MDMETGVRNVNDSLEREIWVEDGYGHVDYMYYPYATKYYNNVLVFGILTVIFLLPLMISVNMWLSDLICPDTLWPEEGILPFHEVWNDGYRLFKTYQIGIAVCSSVPCMFGLVVVVYYRLQKHKPDALVLSRVYLWFLTAVWALCVLATLLAVIWGTLLDHNCSWCLVFFIWNSVGCFFAVKILRKSYREEDVLALYPHWYSRFSVREGLLVALVIVLPTVLSVCHALYTACTLI